MQTAKDAVLAALDAMEDEEKESFVRMMNVIVMAHTLPDTHIVMLVEDDVHAQIFTANADEHAALRIVTGGLSYLRQILRGEYESVDAAKAKQYLN